jgi:hypothetical protein
VKYVIIWIINVCTDNWRQYWISLEQSGIQGERTLHMLLLYLLRSKLPFLAADYTDYRNMRNSMASFWHPSTHVNLRAWIKANQIWQDEIRNCKSKNRQSSWNLHLKILLNGRARANYSTAIPRPSSLLDEQQQPFLLETAGPSESQTPNTSLPAHEGGSGPGGSTHPLTQNYFMTHDRRSDSRVWDKGDNVVRCEAGKMEPSINKEKISMRWKCHCLM